jgi:transposase
VPSRIPHHSAGGLHPGGPGGAQSRLKAAGLTWPLPPDLDDAALERLVYPPPPHSLVRRPEPDWPAIHRELKRPGVMLLLVWEEYGAAHRDGYGYSRFCQLYRACRETVRLFLPMWSCAGPADLRHTRG